MKILILDPDNLHASTILAWFNSSLNIVSCLFAIEEIIPRFAIYPVGKIIDFSCDLCLASFFSSIEKLVSFPETSLEREIIKARVPEISKKLRVQLVNFVQGLRELDLKKLPAISETIDWARTLIILNADELSQELAKSTLNVLLKHQQDIDVVQKEVPRLVMASDV